jgi:hypothetical protein
MTILEDRIEVNNSATAPARLHLAAYDAKGRLVARETYPDYFYEGAWIELVDEQLARVELGVTRIEIELRESDGEIRSAWSMCYDEDGVLIEAFETTTEARHAALMAEQLVRRLRWLVGPGSDFDRRKSATIAV